jgi:DNA-binding GntR family transcriptional regulator
MKPRDGPADLYTTWEHTIVFRLFSDDTRRALSTPEQIAAHTADGILDGRLAPGTKLVEQELATEYGVSRGPVREAVRILERECLVTVLPRRGPMVTELTAREVQELFEVRAALYELVARKTIEMRNEELISTLESGLKRLKHYATLNDDGGQYAETAYRLFMITVKYCENGRLYDMFRALSLQTLRYSKLGLASRQRRQRSYKLWSEALRALRSNDTERYLALARQRVTELNQETLQQLGAHASAKHS